VQKKKKDYLKGHSDIFWSLDNITVWK